MEFINDKKITISLYNFKLKVKQFGTVSVHFMSIHPCVYIFLIFKKYNKCFVLYVNYKTSLLY